MKNRFSSFRILLLLIFAGLSSLKVSAQLFYLHAEYRNDWYGPGYLMVPDITGYPSVTLQAQSQADQFVIEADNSFNKWRKFPASESNLDTPENYALFAGVTITDNFLADSTVVDHYYTTRIKNVGYNTTQAIVMHTTNSPVLFANMNPVTQLPASGSVTPASPVQVTVNLASARSPQERVYIRYTTNNWTSSSWRRVLFGGPGATSGTSFIPAQAAGTTVFYYAFTSTLDSTALSNVSDIDLVTLRYATNGGNNYSYTVNSAANPQCTMVFRVDMTGQSVSQNGVFLAHSLNGFALTGPMTAIGNNVYADTLVADTNQSIQYLFVNGNGTSAQYETVPSACGVPNGLGGFNRFVAVPNQPFALLPSVCFSSCNAACAQSPVQVVFRVDMSQQTVSPSGVFLAGTFNGFSSTADQMWSLGNNIYADTILLQPGTTYQYKFVNGSGTQAVYETVPLPCGVDDGGGILNRSITIPPTQVLMPVVCFGACGNCPPPVVTTAQIVFRVDMTQQTVDPTGVFLAGTFNGWSATANPMTALGNGVYVDTLTLDTSIAVQYKFLNGNSFSGSESVPSSCGLPDGFGGFSRNLNVPNQNAVLPLVCFNLCTACPQPFLVPVVFRVNMSGTTIGPGGVHLAGTFNNFSRFDNPMTPVGNGVYVDTLQLDTAAVHYYKFLNDTNNLAWESVPAPCGFSFGLGNDNRRLFVPETPTVLPVVCFGLCDNSCAPPPQVLVPVIFSVNMSQQTVSPAGVHLAGTFNGFSSSANPMTLIGNGIYIDTLLLDTSAVVQYKFVNGSGSSAVFENVPSACGQVGGGGFINRQISVPNTGGVLPTVCFGECSNCIQPALVNLVIRVNMTGTTVAPQGVHLAGSFNNWSATANPMTPVGGGIYVDTLSLDTTAIIQYKFLNGNNFANEEQVPSSCGVSNGLGGFNRVLAVPQQDSVLAPVCFSSCVNCPQPPVVNVTFRVNMSQTQISPNGLHLVGSFNGFNPTATPMTAAGGGIYQATVALDTTSTVIYKFNNGNLFTTEEVVPAACGVPSTFGGFDRQLVVPEQDLTLPVVCYSQCVDCIVPVNVDVTFRVDLGSTPPDAAGVFLAGTFNGWSTTASPMINTSGSVWETTVSLDTTQVIQYKFVNGNTSSGFEVVPTACGSVGGGGILNRQISVPQTNTILPLVCFGSCSSCVVPVFAEVVFQVNMSLQTVSPSGVFLAGTFNGFSTTANPMTSIGNGIFVDTLLLDTSLVVQYKFVNGSGSSAIFESVPGSCGFIGGGGILNRQLNVPSTNTVLPVVCFGECQNCVLPVFADVTFRVNMSAVQVSAQGVHLAGTFNGFSSTQTPMSPVGSGIYEVTLSLDTTFNVQYKFVNGSGPSAIFEQPGAACGVPDGFGGFNRSLNVPGASITLPTVCFSECADCLPVSVIALEAEEARIFPNPADGWIRAEIPGKNPVAAVVTNVTGQQIQLEAKELGNGFAELDLSQIAPGLYHLTLLDQAGERLLTRTFIKK